MKPSYEKHRRLFSRPLLSSVAFTLMEMLVVIAIISLLAGILLPALTMARERSRQAACSGNLRQIGKAILMYSENYSNLLPYHDGAGVVPRPNASLALLYPTSLDDAKVFQCPSTDDSPTIKVTYLGGHRLSYFGDPRGTSGRDLNSRDPNGSSYGYDHRTNFYELSSTSAIAADLPDHYHTSLSKTIHESANHTSGQNVLYLDGHVTWVPTTRVGGVAQPVYASNVPEDDIYAPQGGWSADTDAFILLTGGPYSVP